MAEPKTDTLQLRYARLASNSSSRIPVKDSRQVSTPIAPLDESTLGGNFKRSSIPRITSSPVVLSPVSSVSSTPRSTAQGTRRSARRSSLSPLINVTNISNPPKLYSETQISTPPGKVFTGSTRSTPPSTVTRLSSQLAHLSLTTPSPSKTPSKQSTPTQRVTRSTTTRELSQIQTAMDTKKTRSTRNLSSTLKATENDKLENRTSALLKSRIRSSTQQQQQQQQQPVSPLKRTITRKASTQAVPTPIKRVASSTVKPKPSTASDNSPLISRLTRSTTAFNLKASAIKRTQRTVSEISAPIASTNASRNIPQAQSIPSSKRFVTEKPLDSLRRSTRSSRLKQEMSVMNLSSKLQQQPVPVASDTPKLNIPKKRSMMTKSFSVNVGLKDMTQASTKVAQQQHPSTQRRVASARPRPISTLYTPTVSSRSTTPIVQQSVSGKCKSPQELHQSLFDFTGTKKSIQEWDSDLEMSSMGTQSLSNALHSMDLNAFEKAEITKSNNGLFYLGNVGNGCFDPSNFINNFGFDDQSNNLIVKSDDHINYRYQVMGKLGTGMFGKVYKCQDHKEHRMVSLKIMRNDPEWSLQSINEIKVLKQLHHPNLLAYIDYFNFRSHICITTELLSVTLLEALEAVKFKGFDVSVIQLWSKQLLSGLEFIHKKNIIHGDLKPENIMLCSPHSFDLKIIDFGSSANTGNVTFPYIQSRFYRAPEVLLGCRYDTKIDIWSFAAVIYEMYTGEPLFEAKEEEHLYKLIVKLIGHPTAKTVIGMRNEVFQLGSINKYNDPEYIDKKTMIFTKFDRIGSYKGPLVDVPRRDQSMQRKLHLDNAEFGAFLQQMLVWNPYERLDATHLLKHGFLREI